jgi:glycosyltransferase A (GT-A) superfamily protein (DUF2064 family)
MAQSAEAAAAALLDTMAAGRASFPPGHRHVALTGHLSDAARGPEVAEALEGWSVFDQIEGSFAGRLAAAHAEVGRRTDAPTVQIGMDTPQVTADLLREVARGLVDHPALLGTAPDGGWWVLALRDPAHAEALTNVPTSTAQTASRTREALQQRGLVVGTAPSLRDVDTVEDARAVAAEAPRSTFAKAWSRLDGETR